MDNLILILTISAAIFSFLAGKAILSSRSSQASGSSEIKGHARKVNDSLYELHKPSGFPSVQIVLFHGLQRGGYLDAHLSTWQSEDGSCIWPQTWLVDAGAESEAIPRAQVLSVAYNQCLENTSQGQIDMYIMAENILSDLLQGNVGQEDYCPVVLVGHSIGGLVIKQICIQAHRMLNNKEGLEKAKLEIFLNNIKCIFYYATPHHGTSIPEKWEKELPRALLAYFKALSKDTQRLNHEFDNLDRVCKNWSFYSLGEDHATNLGPSNDRFILVPEASARVGRFNIVNGADHFSICRPRERSSSSFYKLKDVVHLIASEAQVAKNLEVARRQEEATALAGNFQYVPKSVTGVDIQVQAIKSKLDNVRTLGLVGMGGLGKTTLAKEVFNRLASSFEYTCFIENVKKIDGDERKLLEKIQEEMYVHGNKVEEVIQKRWRTKRLLLVLDDLNGVRDENVFKQIIDIIALESRIIFTSRNKHLGGYSGEVYQVEILNEISAKKLFLSCAFPDREAPPKKFEGLIDEIVKRCDGLPLALDVLGKSLMTTKDSTPDYRIWEETLDAINRTHDHSDINERLWELLRVSYDGLEGNLQQIFLDAATFFCDDRWTLGEAKVAWRAAYDCHESTLWKKLVDMSLVYDVKEDEQIQLHEQLQSLGKMIASEPINNNRRREWDGKEGLRLLQNVEELHEKGIFALRVGENFDSEEDDYGSEDTESEAEVIEDKEYGSEDIDSEVEVSEDKEHKDGGSREMIQKIHITNTAVDALAEMRYLEINAPIIVDGGQICSRFAAKLVLLDCKSADSAKIFLPALGDQIALLKVSWNNSCLPANIGCFSRLRVLRFYRAWHLESLPDEIGNLSQLQELVLEYSHRLQTLPASFGSLSSLNRLEFWDCAQLGSLPESFGSLSSLNRLEFWYCAQLGSLPESFGSLSSLNSLVFCDCAQLGSLPESFGSLSSLNSLQFYGCAQLGSLPESFGSLSSLNRLEFWDCAQLGSLPESFGSLSSLNRLEFWYCAQLGSLPESFGSLSSLNSLVFCDCAQLGSLPESFGSLSSLNSLKFSDCAQLGSLPESFGSLSSLNSLKFYGCAQLGSLPESFGSLSSLNRLEFWDCAQLGSLPESFGSLSSLNSLEFRRCAQLGSLPESFGSLSSLNRLVFCHCAQLGSLPESFGSLSSLNRLEFWDCAQLGSLPESFGSLSSLNRLEFRRCAQLGSLPESFGSLSSLNRLEFRRCAQLGSLPESFGSLSSLNSLEFRRCAQLGSLPESFGSLSSLNRLVFYHCAQLGSLPESFGSLSSLNSLEFWDCAQLGSLPESFGSLSSLNRLVFYHCAQLGSLPESLNHLL